MKKDVAIFAILVLSAMLYGAAVCCVEVLLLVFRACTRRSCCAIGKISILRTKAMPTLAALTSLVHQLNHRPRHVSALRLAA